MSNFAIPIIAMVAVLWLAFAFATAAIAKSKGKDPVTYFIVGFFLGVIGLIIAATLPKEPALNPSNLKKCPYCAESILSEAVKCRFCGADLAG